MENNGLLEAHMAVSRDGKAFVRPSRQPYYPRGIGERRPPDDVFSFAPDFGGAFDSGSTMVAAGALTVGDEIWQYGFGTQSTHGMTKGMLESPELPAKVRSNPDLDPPHDCAITRLVSRYDGLVSLRPTNTSRQGLLLTKALQPPTSCASSWQLVINFESAIGGRVGVRALSPTTRSVVAIGHDSIGNSIRHSVTWRSVAQPPALTSPVALEFTLESANLFSWAIVCA